MIIYSCEYFYLSNLKPQVHFSTYNLKAEHKILNAVLTFVTFWQLVLLRKKTFSIGMFT